MQAIDKILDECNADIKLNKILLDAKRVEKKSAKAVKIGEEALKRAKKVNDGRFK